MVDPGYEIQNVEVLHAFPGSRKSYSSFLEFSKPRFYLLIHATVIGLILLYQSAWLFSKSTTAYCYAYNSEQLLARGEDPGTLVYHYLVDNELHRETTTRNGIPIDQHYINIRYFSLFPSFSRPDTFYGNWGAFIIGWGLFFVISTLIFFVPNETMPRNSFFYFTRRKPWINMIVK